MNEETKIEGKSKKEWQALYQVSLCQWQKVHDYGDPDKMWADGVSLNLIRQDLMKMKEILLSYGEETRVPLEMPPGYMANAEVIQKRAVDNLKKYLDSEDYQYLCDMEPCLSDTQKRRTKIQPALGSIRNLKQVVENGDYVVMREFGQEGQFDRLLVDTAAQVKKLPPVKSGVRAKTKRKEKTPPMETEDWQVEGQMSIYDLTS